MSKKAKNSDPNVRQPILDLAQMLTNRLFYKVKPEDPEYWGLAGIMTDEEAEVAIKMKRRVPRTMADMVKLTGKTEKELEPILAHMSEVGVLEYNWENPQHEKQWVLPMFVPGSAEFTNMNVELLEEHPEMGRFFERNSFLPLAGITQMVPPGGAGIGMHVIPVEKAIPTESQSLDIEHISHWLKKYDGKYAASPCSCRLSRKTFDEGCGDDPMDWCIAVGDMADYVVETKKGGRYISYDEVIEILEKAEERGYVHQITNIDGENKIFAICNCNVNVCYALRTSQLFNTPNLSRSAYVAHVTPEDCVACGRCVEYCPAGAVKLGQKLCTKNGPVKYPKHALPDTNKWGEDKWDYNYRDTNRINCYDTGTAPCKTACPAHIAVQGYLKKAAQGKYTEALALIKKENPFPAVCGAICNRRCEDACTRGTIDQAVAIDEVKKFIAAQDLKAETRYIPPIIKPSVNDEPWAEKVAIIGAGPAGMSCAFYLAEKGYKPTVFEKEQRPGGMLMNGIPSFRLEKDVVEAEIDILKQMGVEFRCGVEVGKDITLDQLRKEGYKAFYIAIGCQGGRKVGIPGEDAEGVKTGVDFLRAVNLDENSSKLSGNTVVVGGGNVAVDVARAASRCGSAKVEMFCLESRDIMPAAKDEVAEAEHEGITVNCGWGPKEVVVENGKVKAIVFKKCLSVFDADHKFAPKYDENDTKTVECENVLLSVGQSIVWGDLLAGSKVELGRGNGAVADSFTYQTAEPDIFVGGDVYTGPKFAIDAIAAGKQGAESIHRFVQPHCTLTIGRNRRQFIELDKKNIVVDSYDNSSRQIPGTDSSISEKSFRDNRVTFTEEQVKAETARCLGCGASVVDPNKCIGCGVCTTKCAFDAIKLSRELPQCSKMVCSEDKVKSLLPYMMKRGVKILFSKKDN
ncbi:MAG: FAD-dependent oxidoreductase [Oscillospiraceae bacterium]